MRVVRPRPALLLALALLGTPLPAWAEPAKTDSVKTDAT